MLDRFERYPLTFGPTPIERLERLSGHLGGAVQIYAKREDCNSGLAFGGNKLRNSNTSFPTPSLPAPTPWSRSAASSRTTRGRSRRSRPNSE